MSIHSTQENAQSTRSLARRALAVAAVLLLGFVLLESVRDLHDEIQAWAAAGVARFGLPVLFVLVWIADTLIQPIPPDLFVFAAGFGGADVFLTAIVGGVASSLGGMTGYFAGRWVGARRFCRWFGRTLMRGGRKLFRDYGTWTILAAAVTPVPYSGACWIAGIYRMNPLVVLITSLLSRTGRYFLMAWFGHLS